MNEIAVRAVDFHAVKTGFPGSESSLGKVGNIFGYLSNTEFSGNFSPGDGYW